MLDITGVTSRQINNKIKDSLINKYHMQTSLVLLTIYIPVKTIGSDVLSTIMFVLLLLIVCFSNTCQLTYLLFLFSPLFLYVTIGKYPIYNVIIGVLILKRFILEKSKIHPVVILTIFGLIVIELVGMFFSGIVFSFNQLKFFLIIFITVMQLYEPAEDYVNITAAKYLIWGTFVYAVFYIVTNFKIVINDSIRTGGLGDLDPNTYGLYNLFAISIILLLIFNKLLSRRQSIIYTFMVIVILIAGIMTLSKTYVLVTGLMLVLYWIAKGKWTKTILIYFLIFITVFFLIQNNIYLKGTFNHLLLRFSTASTLNELTTGRFGLLIEYIEKLWENSAVLLGGSGIYSYLHILNLSVRPHNSTLEAICSWGLFGMSILICMYVKGGKCYKRKTKYSEKIRFINFIPFILLIVFMQSLTLLFQEATYAYIIMSIMLIFTSNSSSKKVSVFKIKALQQSGGYYEEKKDTFYYLVTRYRWGRKKLNQFINFDGY